MKLMTIILHFNDYETQKKYSDTFIENAPEDF